MKYNVTIPLPEGWTKENEEILDGPDGELVEIQACGSTEACFIDIQVGAMPEDETAEDQAFANYAETVGFDEDDPEDFQPVYKIKFNGKNAWCFDALCEGDTPMRLLAQEVRSGVLAIVVFGAENDEALESLQSYLERNLRIK